MLSDAVAQASHALRGLGVDGVSVIVRGRGALPLRAGFMWGGPATGFVRDRFLRQVRGSTRGGYRFAE